MTHSRESRSKDRRFWMRFSMWAEARGVWRQSAAQRTLCRRRTWYTAGRRIWLICFGVP